MLTGDDPLRKFCTDKGLVVHGIIWLFDELLSKQLIKPAIAVEKIKALMSFNNRLPKDECMNRIKLWQVM